ncbi:transglycosylase SLT domain-containing protein [Acetobacter estunensis]|uniref:transglycosylase SLT domain-containing protein n=1 Tax=Acetobacter estunensis TaxID=104097 RepID=UPI0020C3B070|nr:transglycosylase SLT domain-containing protein [Acetobacter estunensis]
MVLSLRDLCALGALAACMVGITPAVADETSCEQAAALAEQRLDIPRGLLAAIGHVESGNRPLAVNVNGLSVPFERPALAADAVKGMLQSGAFGARPRVDVGCFQINLGWHGAVFATIEMAFDPVMNGLAAAAYLRQLRGETGSWRGAVARYHAASSEGVRYAQDVFRFYERRLASSVITPHPSGIGAPKGWIAKMSAHGITVFEPASNPSSVRKALRTVG